MGITIESKRYLCDVGFAGFDRFKKTVASMISDEFSSHYLELYNMDLLILPHSERAEFLKEHESKTDEFIRQGKLPERIADFLICQPDCDGKANRKTAKKIYELIKDCDDDIVFGYSGKEDCTKMSHLKKIFSDGSKVVWY